MFVPLSPDEQEQLKPPCSARDHFPPTHMVITNPCKWVCPACGAEFIINPVRVTCNVVCEGTAAP